MIEELTNTEYTTDQVTAMMDLLWKEIEYTFDYYFFELSVLANNDE